MTYRGPHKQLILPPRTHDIFDANYHPDLDALIALKFQGSDQAGTNPEIDVHHTPQRPMVSQAKLLLGLCVGVPVLSYVMFKLIMILGQ